MTFEKIIKILKCVDCRDGALSQRDGGDFVCLNCCRVYPVINAIPDLRPQTPIRQPKLYDDPDYHKWRRMLAASQDYFYGSGGVIAYVQNAGHRTIRKLMRNKNYAHVLDLGCGDGAHYPYAVAPEKHFGIDIDQVSLEKLQQRYPAFPVLRADGYQLPVKNEGVDCILNIYNLEHMMYLDIALEEMHRVLTAGGDAYISVPNEGGWAWGAGRGVTSQRHFRDINYSRAVAIEHINCIWQLDKAIRRYFKINRRICFPLAVPWFHLNLITTYHCTKSG